MVLHDVVLDERIGGPTVDRETAQPAVYAEGSRVGDWPGTATRRRYISRPNRPTDKEGVTHAVPPGFQPTPTTKSCWVFQLTENPLVRGEYETVPPVV